MRCGADAHSLVTWDFPLVAEWLENSPLGYLVARLLARRVRLVAPFCDRHRPHWSSRRRVVYASLAGALALTALFGVAAWDEEARDPNGTPTFLLLAILTLPAWAALSWLVGRGFIRPYRYSREAVWWKNVAGRFADHVGYRRAELERPAPVDPVASLVPLPPPPGWRADQG
jgi:hypothetical protein